METIPVLLVDAVRRAAITGADADVVVQQSIRPNRSRHVSVIARQASS